MITGELKNRIDSLWEIFWTGGLTNPLDVIEQIVIMNNYSLGSTTLPKLLPKPLPKLSSYGGNARIRTMHDK